MFHVEQFRELARNRHVGCLHRGLESSQVFHVEQIDQRNK
jgi:hypothetical protein